MSDMTVISENDLIESVADALQYISYYHPMDYIRALGARPKKAPRQRMQSPRS